MKASQDEEEILLAVEESLARKTMGMLLLKEEESSSSDLDQKDTNAEISNKNRNIKDPGAIPLTPLPLLQAFQNAKQDKVSLQHFTTHGNSSIPDNQDQITRYLHKKWVPWHPPGR